ncbi:MerR family transcriptional regulator [Brachyspira hampsonii]|uniref:MerR family transcriptional regulator n=1 Tax=Brachyspira hampsonii 30446 TaxID=1289135 RepID=A0A2U4F571_9SPIR|nr:MerR family transcriptional regulator [Brachyspira hampsonii]EKV56110.1 MerR family transcriptional regulator [Brachyspira hampsonii 30446]MBW5390504.1 MerR family transcriptional regulator [Brachyspira hampsonii]MBW5393836.1 MerR family transcriptional regulator [Brachyspira hampsonii]OEJ18049.1 transcriptional regulator [Brachyspira hampsonii]PTY40174.1 transcriptional regulator [Brachyspira hampsonii bv. II]
MTISEVSQLTGLSKDTLRYYEKIGVIPEIGRSKSGIRNYSEYNLKCIEFSKSMRDLGISIDSIIKYIKLYKKGKNTINERKSILINERDLMQIHFNDLKIKLEKLNQKLEEKDFFN